MFLELNFDFSVLCEMLDEGCQTMPTFDPTFNFGPCWDDVPRCWTKAVQSMPTFDPTFTQQLSAVLGRCSKVLDEGCSNGAKVWSNIHPTILDHVGTMLQGVGRRLFRMCQHLIQHSPNSFWPCWDDVARCWMKAVQNVPALDPTFNFGPCWDDIARCWTKAIERCQHMIQHSTILDHVGMMLLDVGRRLFRRCQYLDLTFTQQFWTVLGWLLQGVGR